MPIPNFLIIGAQKAGTTWLAAKLQQHPEVFIPNQEVHYFDKAYNYCKGMAWYQAQFANVQQEKAIGEKTPDYLWANGNGWEDHLPDVHYNIKKDLPEAKLIIVLRNPVERAISALNHILRSGRISPLHDINELLIGNKKHLVTGYGVLEKGFYYQQIQAYKSLFPEDQILIIDFEQDILQKPDLTLKKIFNFLDVNESYSIQNLKDKVNDSQISRFKLAIDYYFPKLKPITRRYARLFPKNKLYPHPTTLKQLYQIYAEPNEKLFDLLGYRIVAWEPPT